MEQYYYIAFQIASTFRNVIRYDTISRCIVGYENQFDLYEYLAHTMAECDDNFNAAIDAALKPALTNETLIQWIFDNQISIEDLYGESVSDITSTIIIEHELETLIQPIILNAVKDFHVRS